KIGSAISSRSLRRSCWRSASKAAEKLSRSPTASGAEIPELHASNAENGSSGVLKTKSQKWPAAAPRPDPRAWLSEPPLTFAGERQLSTGAPALRSWYKGPDRRTQFRRLAISSRDAEAGTRADSWRADAHQVCVHCSPNLLRYGL